MGEFFLFLLFTLPPTGFFLWAGIGLSPEVPLSPPHKAAYIIKMLFSFGLAYLFTLLLGTVNGSVLIKVYGLIANLGIASIVLSFILPLLAKNQFFHSLTKYFAIFMAVFYFVVLSLVIFIDSQ